MENDHLQKVKDQIGEFFEKAQRATIIEETKGEVFYFNKDLFELERRLFELKRKYDVNTRLDASIYSENIVKSFEQNKKAFASHDYTMAFLIHLCYQPEHNAEDLFQIIRSFINRTKEKFSYQDIIVTRSGATRCVTNIRFALHELRELGLVFNAELSGNETKRIVLPTPIGYLISLHALTNEGKGPDQFLLLENSIAGYNNFLFDSIFKLKHSLKEFFHKIVEEYPEITDLYSDIGPILDNYNQHILPYIEITETKLIVHEKEIKKSFAVFYKLLHDHIGLSYTLKEIFLNHTHKTIDQP